MTLEITYKNGKTEQIPVTTVGQSFISGKADGIYYEHVMDETGGTCLSGDDISHIRITSG